MKQKLKKCKLTILDDTPDSGLIFGRGQEIRTWLDNHPEVTDYVILDDEEFRDFEDYGVSDHVVYTSYGRGLTEAGVNEAIRVLGSIEKTT